MASALRTSVCGVRAVPLMMWVRSIGWMLSLNTRDISQESFHRGLKGEVMFALFGSVSPAALD